VSEVFSGKYPAGGHAEGDVRGTVLGNVREEFPGGISAVMLVIGLGP